MRISSKCVVHFLLAAGLAAPLLCVTDPADARRERAERVPEKPQAQKTEAGPVLIVISIARQRVSVYGSSGLIAQSGVSTGRPGFRTPTGVFSVLQKSRWHRSNIYSGAPMPYMQRITWSGVALHAGVLPGYPASHGCIRMTHAFAAELWGMTRLGARVVVAPDDAEAVAMASARLPVPTLTPAAAGQDSRPGDRAATEAETPMVRSAALVSAARAETASESDAAARAPVKLLNPLERAKAAKVQFALDVTVRAKEAKAALDASAQKAAEANKAIAAVRDIELALVAATARRDAAAKSVEAAKTPEVAERANATLADAEAKLLELEKSAAEARLVESFKTPEAFAAARAAWDAEKASDAAVAALKSAERSTEPISIFVSRKAARVYIRQGWSPIHEATATFKEPAAPLGTHVYVATQTQDDSKAMRWLSVSMPASAPAPESRPASRHGARDRHAAPPVHHAAPPRETAASVLERFELSEDTTAFISERLWLGASLIVSDEGISNETGKYTDFIVLTR
jgi:hypothetical protein